MLALSSAARLFSVVGPLLVGVQESVQELVPVARWLVAPLSVDTSTAATRPPPTSVAVPHVRAPSSDRVARGAEARVGHREEAARSRAVVQILIGLVADDVLAQRGGLPGAEVRDAGVAPEAQLAVRRRHL